MEAWRKAWRDGFVPALVEWCRQTGECDGRVPPDGDAAAEAARRLRVLATALAGDDPALVQGATTVPSPLLNNSDLPVEACDPVTYLGWLGGPGDCRTVGDAEAFFADLIYGAAVALGEPDGGATRPLLNWWDDTPRAEVFAGLLHECRMNADVLDGTRPAYPADEGRDADWRPGEGTRRYDRSLGPIPAAPF